MHTLNSGAAILSFVSLSCLTRWLITDCKLRYYLDKIEGIVLIVLVVIFAYNVIVDLLPESLRNAFPFKLVLA
jgi:hypothetical protein